MAEGEALRGPCDETIPRHLLDLASGVALYTVTYSTTVFMPAKNGEEW